jgi:lysyl-tRNA synthetase class 2
LNTRDDELNKVMRDRREALEKLRAQGIDPYPYRFEPTHTLEDARGLYDESDPDGRPSVRVAGRIIAPLRLMGKAAFTHLQDESGRLQIYLKRDDLGEDVFKWAKKLDMGDIVGVDGGVFRTRTGEVTVHARSVTLLCKNLRPLPVVKEKDGEVYDAFTDKEARYRRRHVDLMVNPQNREVFRVRSRIITACRKFLDGEGFLEMETPILQPVYGGAMARPFSTHHHTLDTTLYLRIADELYLKRLLVGGFEKVYEICKDFRNEGIDRNHNPEFTMLEWYAAYEDYRDAMVRIERMISAITKEVLDSLSLKYQGHDIDLKPPWKRVAWFEALRDVTDEDLRGANKDTLTTEAHKLELEVEDFWGVGKILDEIFKEVVQPRLMEPTIVYDYPLEMSPLAKKHRSEEGLVERFQFFAGGLELGNAFSELNDPMDQRARFEEQVRLRKAGDHEAHEMDQDFVEALEVGMPPAAGLGLGVDRLVMLLTDQSSIRDVILFPSLRPEA